MHLYVTSANCKRHGCGQTAGASPSKVARIKDVAPSHSFCLMDGNGVVVERECMDCVQSPVHAQSIQITDAVLLTEAGNTRTKSSGFFLRHLFTTMPRLINLCIPLRVTFGRRQLHGLEDVLTAWFNRQGCPMNLSMPSIGHADISMSNSFFQAFLFSTHVTSYNILQGECDI